MNKIIEIISRIIEVIIGLRRNLAMSVASIVLIFLTFFILGFSVLVMLNVQKTSAALIEGLSVYAYVEETVQPDQEAQIISQVESISDIKSVELSDKEAQLKQVTEIWGDDGETFREYFSGEKNPLNDVLIIKAKDDDVDLNSLAIKIGGIEGIESVGYGEDSGADGLISFLKKIQLGATVVTIIFAFITIFLIINTIKLTINSRRKEIEIMRLVGASKSYIIFPFAVEGIILGLIGGVLSFIVTYIAYKHFIDSVALLKIAKGVVSATEAQVPLMFSQIVFALIVGLGSSIVAIRSYLKI